MCQSQGYCGLDTLGMKALVDVLRGYARENADLEVGRDAHFAGCSSNAHLNNQVLISKEGVSFGCGVLNQFLLGALYVDTCT